MACDLIAHHDKVHQPLGQESSVIVSQLQRGQLAQVLTLQDAGTEKTMTISDDTGLGSVGSFPTSLAASAA